MEMRKQIEAIEWLEEDANIEIERQKCRIENLEKIKTALIEISKPSPDPR